MPLGLVSLWRSPLSHGSCKRLLAGKARSSCISDLLFVRVLAKEELQALHIATAKARDLLCPSSRRTRKGKLLAPKGQWQDVSLEAIQVNFHYLPTADNLVVQSQAPSRRVARSA